MTQLTVWILVNSPLEKVWESFTNSEKMIYWSFASDDWYCPKSSWKLEIWNKFSATFAAKDWSMSFELEWEYTYIDEYKKIEYIIIDMQYWEFYIEKWRKVSVIFEKTIDWIKITETFDAEEIHPNEMQIAGWQAILENFKKYCESLDI